jgi:hypothetical protein
MNSATIIIAWLFFTVKFIFAAGSTHEELLNCWVINKFIEDINSVLGLDFKMRRY